MSDIREIHLGDTPPWEEAPPHRDEDAPGKRFEWFDDGYGDSDYDDEEEVDESSLEIYRKAENFKRLRLVSGGNLDVPVKKYIAEHYGREGVTRRALAEFVMKTLNYIPSDDVMLALSCTNKARVIIATAGAGKTTSLQIDLVVSKMMDTELHCYHVDPVRIEGTEVYLPSILYLNYNKHNVQPCLDKHKAICAKVNSALQETINDDIESTTVHAFCYRWLNAFAGDVSLPELKIATDSERSKLWDAVIRPRWKKFYGEQSTGIAWQVLDELYIYKVESMLDWDDFFVSAKFIDSGLKSDFTKSCIQKYEALKRSMGLLDFTDYVMLTIETLRDHEDLRKRLQERYRIIIADENQDFTAMMNELLLLLYNPRVNRLIVVGDSDQTIYEFKGVSPDNVVNLVDRLEDVALLGLDTNYRCPDKIVDAAKKILDMNIMRFDKPIKTVRTGGEIIRHPWEIVTEQSNDVLALLNQIGQAGWRNTVVAYRNNRSSLILGEEMYYAGIPFNVIDDQRPFNNIVFKHIRTCLTALHEKDNYDYNKTLYRFLPLPKEMWEQILEANSKKRRTHLHDLIMPINLPRGTEEALGILVNISAIMDENPCSDYVSLLFGLYRKYYYDFIRQTPESTLGPESYQELLIERSLKFWSRPQTFTYMVKELQERNVDRVDSVTLSTFHGLKGLEFDYVIAIDFDDAIFPNFYGIEQKYPRNTAMETKEAENRLCYVLVTRARKELHLFYKRTDPSIYLEKLCPMAKTKTVDATEVETMKQINLGTVSGSMGSASARFDFIKKLTDDRRN